MTKFSVLNGVRTIDFAGAAVGICLSFAAYWLAVLPVLSQRSLEAARAAELANLRMATEDQRAKQGSALSAIERLKAELASCEVKPVPVSALNTRIMELGELAAESGLVVVTIKGEDAKPSNKRIQVPIKVIARGPYFSVSRFLKDVNVKFRDTAVEKFNASAVRSENEEDDALTQIDLTWYAVYDGASDVASAPNP